MNTLYKEVATNQLAARKAKDPVAVPLLSTLLGQLQKVAKDKNQADLDDSTVIAEVRKFLKSNTELQAHVTGEALELAKKEQALLEVYMPKQLSVQEIENYVKIAIDQGHTVIGKIMGYFKANHEGLYDGGAVKTAIEKALSK